MNDNPDMKIVLKGYIDKITEGSNCELAIQRAESVKKYIIDTWHISPDRIDVYNHRGRCFPRNMTSSLSEMGFADNRRVEVLANDMKIYEPVVIRTPVDLSAPNEGKITITPKYSNRDSVAEWRLFVKNGSKELFKDNGELLPKEISLDIKKFSLKHDLNFDKPIEIEFYIREKDSRITYGKKIIPIKTETADIETKRIAYILFDVEKMILNKINESTLKTILNNIGSFHNLNITGYTDILGDYSSNKELSLSRAITISKIIKRIKPDGLNVEVKGAATDSYPFGVKSYSTQIERFLSRSVVVELY
jgi:outer membrane protein OmpA-like peptidoglycan-associated protein